MIGKIVNRKIVRSNGNVDHLKSVYNNLMDNMQETLNESIIEPYPEHFWTGRDLSINDEGSKGDLDGTGTGVVLGSTGLYGGSLDLGSGDDIDFAGARYMPRNFTISFWYNPTAVTTHTIFHKGTNISINVASTYLSILINGTTYTSTTTVLVAGELALITLAFEDSVGLKAYVNETLEISETFATELPICTDAWVFDGVGSVSDIRFYEIVLKICHISGIYNSGKGIPFAKKHFIDKIGLGSDNSYSSSDLDLDVLKEQFVFGGYTTSVTSGSPNIAVTGDVTGQFLVGDEIYIYNPDDDATARYKIKAISFSTTTSIVLYINYGGTTSASCTANYGSYAFGEESGTEDLGSDMTINYIEMRIPYKYTHLGSSTTIGEEGLYDNAGGENKLVSRLTFPDPDTINTGDTYYSTYIITFES